MAKLKLSVAVGDYDRTRALIDGAVQIDGVDPVFMTLVPEEIFFRAFRAAEFDICELSLSSYTMKTAQGNSPYIAVPAFVSRAFRHTAIYVRTDRVQEARRPQGPQGRRAGISAHGQCLGARLPRRRLRRQARGHPLDSRRHRGAGAAGKDHAQAAGGRAPRQRARGRDDFRIARSRRDRRLHRAASAEAGRAGPSAYRLAVSPIRSRWRRIISSAPDFFRSCTSLGIRRELAERHPWLPGAVFKAFEQAKAVGGAKARRHVGDQA